MNQTAAKPIIPQLEHGIETPHKTRRALQKEKKEVK
jgi:hypothetical protein